MNRPEKQVFERLGAAGLSRVLADVMDQTRLVRLANACDLKYPGMRTRSQKPQRILTDLVEKAGAQATTRKAIYRALQKETRTASREWSRLADAEREKRLGDDAFLLSNGNLGRHLFVLACSADDDAQADGANRFERLLAIASNGHQVARARGTAKPSRTETRLKKTVAQLENKVQHLEGQLSKTRESERGAKRDLIRRKGELAESRMLAERLRKELAEAQAAARRADASPAGALEALQEHGKSVRKLANQQRKLAHAIDKMVAAPSARAELDPDPVSQVAESLKDVQKEVAGLKRDRRKETQEQLRRLEEMHGAVQSLRKVIGKPPRRSRVKGESARVGVFVDVQNMYYAARQLKGKLDFDALLSAAVRDRRLIQATAYVVESKEIDQSGFIAVLQKRAIEVRRKNLRVRADGSMKGDWDMELALDILDGAPQLDVVVLVSGDGDFTSLVKRVKRMGPRVEVIGFPRNTAKSLLEAADEFQPLDRKFMIYAPRTKSTRRPQAASADKRPSSEK